MARKYDHEYKVQAVKLAKEIGGAKAAKELGIPDVYKRQHYSTSKVVIVDFEDWMYDDQWETLDYTEVFENPITELKVYQMCIRDRRTRPLLLLAIR